MQPRFAALLFALGLVDLAYVNLSLGHEVFADTATPPTAELQPAPPSAAELPPEPPSAAELPPEPPRVPTPDPNLPPDDQLAAQTDREPPLSEPPTPGIVAPSGEPAPSAEAPTPSVTPPMLGPAHTGTPSALPADALPADALPADALPADALPADALPADGRLNDGQPALEVPATEPPLAQPGSDVTVGFPDKATVALTGRAREELLALAARLHAHPEYHVRIVGHADARGSREFNRDLGNRRARAVVELLTRAGVRREQLDFESRGEDDPRIAGSSERVWAANRRVEITIGSERSETP